jgi:hypothetical protein
VSYNELAVLAGYAGPPEGEEEEAADGRWLASLPADLRRWVRRVVESHPSHVREARGGYGSDHEHSGTQPSALVIKLIHR